MPSAVDIVVVGAGVAGAATARALAGHRGSVVLLEQYEVGHAHGSSHGTSRILRLNYPDERWVTLARAADAAWRELESERGERIVERVGSLDLGPGVSETGRALAAGGVRHETLAAAEVAARWPLRLEPAERAVFQPDGGFIHADRALEALLASARDGGVEIRERSPVRALAVEPRFVRVTLDAEEIAARAVVVTAGAWGRDLVAPVGVELPVVPTRETVAYVELPGAESVPAVIDYGSLPAPGEGGITRVGQAAYSLAAPGRGLKAGLHHSGPVTAPGDDPGPDGRVAAWISSWARSRFAGAGDLLGAETCVYTSTADEEFVLERHGRVVVGSACSGHGFKFAPVVGRTLAAMAREASG